MSTAFLQPGAPAPWFIGRTNTNPRYCFHTVAGRWVVLSFFGSTANEALRRRLSALLAESDRYDDNHLSFFGVSIDPGDVNRLKGRIPGIRFFWDFDLAISRLYGAALDGPQGDNRILRPHTLILDPSLRVFAHIDYADPQHDDRFRMIVRSLPPVDEHGGPTAFAPVLMVPRVFEPALCRHLITLYDQHGGYESGFMQEIDGKTVGVSDPRHKRRIDYDIVDDGRRPASGSCAI